MRPRRENGGDTSQRQVLRLLQPPRPRVPRPLPALQWDRLCKQCRATDLLDTVFTAETLAVQPKLAALADHLRATDPAYIIQIKRRSGVWQIIVSLAALPEPVTHAHLDSIGTARAVAQVRSLLVRLEVLDPRDEYVVAFQKLAAEAIATLPHRADQLVLRRFIRRRRPYREDTDQLTISQMANDRNELRIVLSLVRAFNADKATMATARQSTLDAWVAHAPSAFRVRRFLLWCDRVGVNRRLVPPSYQRPAFNLGGTLTEGNGSALRRVLSEDTHSPRMRLAVLLNVVYAIRVHRIAALRRDALRLDEGIARIRLGSVELELPQVATPWVEAILEGVPIRHGVGGGRRDDTWVFPGYCHDDHMLSSSLATKLRALGVSPAAAHQTSVAVLVTQVSAPVIARLLGVSIATATHWHSLAGNESQHR